MAGIYVNARQGWSTHVAEVDIIVDSDNCHIVWYAQAGTTAGVECLVPPIVVTGHDPDRLSQSLEPARDLLLLDFPGAGAAPPRPAQEDIAILARRRHQLNEYIAAAVLIRVFSARRTAKGEMYESALPQMLEAEDGDRAIIETDKWNRQIFECARTSTAGSRVARIASAIRRSSIRARIPSPFHCFSQVGGRSLRPCGSK